MKATLSTRFLLFYFLVFFSCNAWSQTATPWVTTPNQSKLLQQQAAIDFTSNGGGATNISINDAITYQSIDGFGIALTEGSAEVISTLSASQQTALLEELYGSSGLGISVVRMGIGASDLSAYSYSYQDFKSYSSTTAPVGGYVRLKSVSNNKYICSNDGGSAVLCGSSIASSWETFKVIDAGNGLVALQGSNGKYISGNSPMWCNSSTIGNYEMFSWVCPTAGQVQLKCSANNFFACSENGTTSMNCNRSVASGWETFNVEAAEFSLSGPDLTYVIPILKKIIAINPDVKILATPWSAPSWMKTSLKWVGGTLQVSYYTAYADYFKSFLDAMKSQGITVWGITPQNEPENANNEPSMTFTASEEFNFIDKYLGPTIRNAGYNTKIIGFDHNCDNTAYPITVCGSSFVDGSAFHLYGGDILTLSTVKNATNKNVYFTEQYTGSAGSFDGDFQWHIKNVMLGALNNWAKISCEWNLATDANFGPHTPGGTTTSKGAVTISNPTSITRNVSYYILGQLSKFVKPNAVRIGSSSNNPNLINTAFRNSDGSIVLVVLNDTGASSTFSTVSGSKSFAYTLESGSAASFVWNSPITSMDGAIESERINIYPNPSEGRVRVFGAENCKILGVKVVDFTGSVLLKISQITDNSLDLSSLESGVYFVLFDIDGGATVSRKITIVK